MLWLIKRNPSNGFWVGKFPMALSFVFAGVILHVEVLIVYNTEKKCLNFRFRCYFNTPIDQKGSSNSEMYIVQLLRQWMWYFFGNGSQSHRQRGQICKKKLSIYYSIILNKNCRDGILCCHTFTVENGLFITVEIVKSRVK